MNKEVILSARNLRKCFKGPQEVEVLRSISLDLFPSETLSIMGRSGAGKSTLLHLLGTLESPTSGRLLIDGEDTLTANLPLIRNQKIGFVFQSYNLLEEYTVLDNLLMVAKIGRKPIGKKSASYERALSLLEKVGLLPRAKFQAKLLSGGEKQRVAIARSLVNDPLILLADEPSGNLDAKNAEMITNLLIDCCKEFRKSLIVVTHDKLVCQLCDRALTLEDGTLRE